MIMETKTLSGDGSLKLRLSEESTIAGYNVPKGTELVAETKFQGTVAIKDQCCRSIWKYNSS
jgi:hypothetical protein